MSNKFFIITGMSGAGKSQALKILEDLGFFCVDNLPLSLVPEFIDLSLKRKFKNVALGIDIRAGKSLSRFDEIIKYLKKRNVNYKAIYFDANDSTLLQRYFETRRRHPLGRRVSEGIARERRLMSKIYSMSDKEIDTSSLNIGELKEVLAKELGISPGKVFSISLLSFGYKYGLPSDADLVIDVRFLPNPNYVKGLRTKTGRNGGVRQYVQKQRLYKIFFNKFSELVRFLLPKYIKEGKSYLTIAFGCTGGRHRSVVLAESMAKWLKKRKYFVKIYHRDIDRGI